jgi:hypothetical protein
MPGTFGLLAISPGVGKDEQHGATGSEKAASPPCPQVFNGLQRDKGCSSARV